jgi:probable rRNA maturation factor
MSIKHKIYFLRGSRGVGGEFDIPLLKRCIRKALDMERVDKPCELSVLMTDDSGIREYNREYRNIDAPTDVLSFPLQTLTPGCFDPDESEVSPETGLLPLGDIVLNAGRIRSQAEEYGQTPDREMVYLAIHSVLHLLGYDHMDEGPEKKKMRAREKEILRGVGFGE